jgi:F-type H+-transporting ATPase subunit gamma
VLVISTDKGLCGALNTNLLRVVAQFDPAGTKFVTVGRKGAQYLARTKRELVAEFAIKETFTFVDAKQVSKFCVEQFLSGAVSKVTVVYSDFINALRQEPRAAQLLPLEDFSLSTLEGAAGRNVIAGDGEGVEFKFEPTVVDFLDVLLPHFIHFRVYQMILESRASEHSARMVAMKNATDNAKALIKELTLEYNKIRQASITTEILEIATAQMALA